MAVIKHRRIEEKKNGKRAKYSEGPVPGSSKLSGVNRCFILGALPFTQENYANVKLLLSQMDMSDLKPTYSADLKMDIYLIGRVYSTCKHNCVMGNGTTPWNKTCELITVGEARMWHAKYLEAGGTGTGIQFQNFVYEILFQYPDETYIIDILNFPELHVMLGITTKLYDYIMLFSSTAWCESVLSALNITQTHHRGKKGLNGNACKKLIEHASLFIVKSKGLPDSCDKDKIVAAAKTMSLFNAVVDSSFGVLVEGDWIQAIHNFCASYRALPGITFPPKYHLVEGHLQQFLERRWQQDCYKGFGLGYWSEQPFEAVHHKFDEFWERYKVGRDHEMFGQKLMDAVMSWNSRRK